MAVRSRLYGCTGRALRDRGPQASTKHRTGHLIQSLQGYPVAQCRSTGTCIPWADHAAVRKQIPYSCCCLRLCPVFSAAGQLSQQHSGSGQAALSCSWLCPLRFGPGLNQLERDLPWGTRGRGCHLATRPIRSFPYAEGNNKLPRKLQDASLDSCTVHHGRLAPPGTRSCAVGPCKGT